MEEKKENKQIRNFVIIAHIDHGKSTLADRFLEITGTVSKDKLIPQYLDAMNLEKKHGITIKMHPVRMIYRPSPILNPESEILNNLERRNPKLEIANSEFILNLIDTPGHVDFTYEVSRALAAVEGAILLVDATQGIQAQTLSNLLLAKKQGLKIIGAINKIDLEVSDLETKIKELADLLKINSQEIVLVSAKSGKNIEELLEKAVKEIPEPKIDLVSPFQALVFDSHYDPYKGIIAYIRTFKGRIKKGEKIVFCAAKTESEIMSLGYFSPQPKETDYLQSGEIGWLATGLKDPNLVKVGDTVVQKKFSDKKNLSSFILPGYQEPKSMVFAGFYLASGEDFENFKYALSQLKLNDSALNFIPEKSEILGRGYRLGFLGMLHLKIIQERLKEEYNLDFVITNPTVPYKVWLKKDKNFLIITNPSEWPKEEDIDYTEESWVKMEIIAPPQYLSAILGLVNASRGEEVNTLTISERLMISCQLPLAEVIKDFYDRLKSVSSGYASLNYEFLGYKKSELEKIEVLIAGKVFESLSKIVFKAEVEKEAKSLAKKLKDLLPRQNYAMAIQIKGFGRIISRENVPALRKDVTGYLYGGDRTRKMKLWAKQKKGKKKLLEKADIQIPTEVFLKIFSK